MTEEGNCHADPAAKHLLFPVENKSRSFAPLGIQSAGLFSTACKLDQDGVP